MATTTAPTLAGAPARKPYDPLTGAIDQEFQTSVGPTSDTGIPTPMPSKASVGDVGTTGVREGSALAGGTTALQTQPGTYDIYGRPISTQPSAATTPKTGMTSPSPDRFNPMLPGEGFLPGEPRPDTPGGSIPAPTQPMNPNEAMNKISVAFQARHGRPMTPAEQQQLIAAVGYTGGMVTPQQYQQALQLVEQYNAGGTPGAPGPTDSVEPNPLPGGQGIDPNVAMNTVKSRFQTKHGRAMTDAEWQQLLAAVGVQPGQQVTQAMLDQALALVDQYNAGQVPTEEIETPGGGIDPNVAMNNAKAAFQTKFGRPMTDQEWTALITQLGLKPGDPITDAIMAQALDLISKYSGDINNPWGPAQPGGPGTGGPGTTTPPPTEETEAERLARLRLEELLKQGWGSVDPNDPALKGQMDANALDQQRSTNRKRAALAERAAARGGIQSGGFDVDQERLLQEQGESEQQFNANLYAQELEGQRERLMEGIKIATDLGLAQDAQKLQEELARLELSIKEYLGKGQLSLGLLEAYMNDARFYDELGFNMAKLIEYLNSQAIGSMFA